ncbi:type I-F CRISPR-associated helicase Cas3f [Catenovulum sediminis]|uniref:Type I-F CRISPR-associated helicase Cas3f n=1 Tax=Catenovulum sediminis TaxID=1740262 RepID=A0ABV1RK78_9ALTE
MMVTFVSQCQKNALKKTRRVLDAFANRIGDNTWQTVITEDGLITVKKMLRQTATKSTAVSCHWIRSRSRSQLLWVVGNRSKFNSEGVVAVNYTKLNLDHKDWESGWELNEAIVLAAGIAGLFHDFGKANDLFQQKLIGKSGSKSEPFRHEWVSLRLFEAFVTGLSDQVWIQRLVDLPIGDNAQKAEKQVIENCIQDDISSPFASIHTKAPFAKLVAWLIVSHHRLPLPQTELTKRINFKDGTDWLTSCFNCHWNSKNAEQLTSIDDAINQANWQFSTGTPFKSKMWQRKASEIAKRALAYPKLKQEINWLEQSFVSHLARLSLMLSDHYYSSLPIEACKHKWQDKRYKASANTDRKTGQLKQKLDEHNIGVAHNAYLFAKHLPALKYTLPTIAEHRLFSKNAPQTKFQWQDKAFKKAKGYAKQSERQGFFGINMASTGCGKTLANAKIMYALADEREGCRFSVALGLRTLTLQTGDAYRNLLKLGDDELAVLIGSSAVQLLHQLENAERKTGKPENGSESSDDLFEQLFISYEGQIYDGRLKHWLKGNPKLEQLISAPIVVSTIDHLMPATESKRGGKQIAPMLRLLTSDLVLDEPDDFSLEDLPALCRLVNWAGLLGSRVLLSSATMPPALIDALYNAYAAGRKKYNQANFPHDTNTSIVCGWFDEHSSEIAEVNEAGQYKQASKNFVDKRLTKLSAIEKVLRKGEVINVEVGSSAGKAISRKNGEQAVYQAVANTIHEQIHQLHIQHSITHSSGKKVSVGVVRLANINPLVAVAKALLSMSPHENFTFHFCIYHSQLPLALRSYKESRLDKILTRYNDETFWQHSEILKALNNNPAENQVFIVLGTSVVEVGRDHDYDWAIAEPSSLRSIIQLAGRVQRHRQLPPEAANIAVLNQNIRALKGDSVAYCKPGFETANLPLTTKDLNELITNELANISAIPRIQEPTTISVKDFKKQSAHQNESIANPVASFAIQEHRALRVTLDIMGRDKNKQKNIKHPEFYNSPNPASLWWESNPAIDWNGVLIQKTEFRKSQAQEEYVLRLPEDEKLVWSQLDDTRWPPKYVTQSNKFKAEMIDLADGNHWWFNVNTEQIYQNLAEKLDLTTQEVSEKFGKIGLRAAKENEVIEWYWHEQLGVYQIK